MDEFVDAKIHCTKNKYIYNFLAAKYTHTHTYETNQAPAAAAAAETARASCACSTLFSGALLQKLTASFFGFTISFLFLHSLYLSFEKVLSP